MVNNNTNESKKQWFCYSILHIITFLYQKLNVCLKIKKSYKTKYFMIVSHLFLKFYHVHKYFILFLDIDDKSQLSQLFEHN